MLKDSIAAFGQHLWERHPGKCVCGTAGILLGNMYSDIWVLEYALHFFNGGSGPFCRYECGSGRKYLAEY